MKIFPSLLAFTMGAAPLQAGLEWESQRIEMAATPSDTFAEAKFRFVNQGPDVVSLGELKSSCGCTVARLAKTLFRPGERGEVVARFDFGQRYGLQTKTISVPVSGEKEPRVLTLVVNIPEQLKISPGIVVWTAGADAQPKKIRVEAMPGLPTRVIRATSTDARIQTRIEVIKDSAEYVLSITPETTASHCFAILDIETEWQGGKKTFQAYAQIRVPQR
jgi:hypothetical protein